MGIRGRFLLVTVLIALTVGGSSYWILERSNQELLELNAVRIADIVTSQVAADRAEYSANVVGKLKKEGTGSAVDSPERQGYVQLPAQFARAVSQRVAAQAGDLYSYSLLSEWNLHEDQGLKDDFDRWAWRQLMEQDAAFQAAGPPDERLGYPWKPVYRFETAGGAPVLRYLRADPASADRTDADPRRRRHRPAQPSAALRRGSVRQVVHVALGRALRPRRRDPALLRGRRRRRVPRRPHAG